VCGLKLWSGGGGGGPAKYASRRRKLGLRILADLLLALVVEVQRVRPANPEFQIVACFNGGNSFAGKTAHEALNQPSNKLVDRGKRSRKR